MFKSIMDHIYGPDRRVMIRFGCYPGLPITLSAEEAFGRQSVDDWVLRVQVHVDHYLDPGVAQRALICARNCSQEYYYVTYAWIAGSPAQVIDATFGNGERATNPDVWAGLMAYSALYMERLTRLMPETIALTPNDEIDGEITS